MKKSSKIAETNCLAISNPNTVYRGCNSTKLSLLFGRYDVWFDKLDKHQWDSNAESPRNSTGAVKLWKLHWDRCHMLIQSAMVTKDCWVKCPKIFDVV